MSHGLGGGGDDDDGDEVSSGSEGGGALFDEDMEALRRACVLTGADADAAVVPPGGLDSAAPDSDSDDDEDDLKLVRRLQERFSADLANPLTLKPLASIHPPAATSDEDEDDFETLRAIQKRFCAYDHSNTESKNGLSSTGSMSNTIPVNIFGGCKVFPDNEDTHGSNQTLNKDELQPSALIEWHQPAQKQQGLAKYSSFPKSGQTFIDALKKNRSCQKLFRSKLIQIEARIEEIKKLKERVKILKDFQVSCRQRTGKALSQKKDPRVQLISASKTTKDSKVNDKKFSAMYYGPAENSHVSSYRMALTRFPLSLQRSKWSEVEKENLGKGIKQQFQETLLQISLDRYSASDGDQYGFEDILSSIRDFDITPESIREFLPKVNWDQLASLYIPGRSGAECEARWLNWEDPLINHGRWAIEEDKHLLFFIQEKGINNWFEVAASLGTKRTPFQCLARYQRSLNPCILKSEWTPDEDAQLRAIVETFGESDWQAVASALEGRTGTQCSNRWKKTLHPARRRVGRWTDDEDKRLRVAVKLFGAKNWMKIADFVPGRTQVQCRERWVNCLDPSLNWNRWTPEEDAMLEAAIAEHGYCWSKIAACLAPRTDNQCRRRWKVLFPHEVPLLRDARKVQKAALVRNFVDRESERPALGPGDFLPLSMTNCVSVPDSLNPSMKQKTGSSVSQVGSRRKRKANESNVMQVSRSSYNEVDYDELAERGSSKKTRVTKRCAGKKSRRGKQAKDHTSISTTSVVPNGEISEANGLSGIAEHRKISPRVQKKGDPEKPQFNSGLVVEKASCKNDETVAKHGSLLRNEKVTKLHSNEGRPNGHAIDHSSCQLDLTSLVMANGEDQAQGMSDFRQKGKIVTCDWEVGNKTPTVDSQLDLEQAVEIISCNEDERVSRDKTVSKMRKVSNACLRKEGQTEHSKDQQSSQPDSSSSLRIKGKNIEAVDSSNMTQKEKNVFPRAQKNLRPEKTRKDGRSHMNHDEVVEDAPAELTASKENRNYKTYKRRNRNVALPERCYSNSECIPALPENLNRSQSVSISCEKDGPEQLLTGNEPVSQQVPDTDDCDITLASLLIEKQKKKKKDILKSSEGNGMPCDVDQTPPNVRYRSEEPNLVDLNGRNASSVGSTREKLSNDLAFNCEDGDITLACFLRDKSMKKRP
ncbi:uncharacterized protein J3R85_000235 [Psidium guajava]|nr:uncharacterized protein J3R85_000235 [Psidium guajava]